jgi:hypothetical protein
LEEVSIEASIQIGSGVRRDGQLTAGAEGLRFSISRKPLWPFDVGAWRSTHFFPYESVAFVNVSVSGRRMKRIHVELGVEEGPIRLNLVPSETADLFLTKLAIHGLTPSEGSEPSQ